LLSIRARAAAIALQQPTKIQPSVSSMGPAQLRYPRAPGSTWVKDTPYFN
jgi:hypothetical protein